MTATRSLPKRSASWLHRSCALMWKMTAEVLLLCHAFTNEMSYPRREAMMNAAVKSLAVMLPAFDSMLMSSMAQEVAALRAKKGGAK